jgi:hypothetical protein
MLCVEKRMWDAKLSIFFVEICIFLFIILEFGCTTLEQIIGVRIASMRPRSKS